MSNWRVLEQQGVPCHAVPSCLSSGHTAGMSEAQAEQVKAGETSYPAASKAEEAAACTASHADQSEEGAGRDSQGGGNQPAEAAEAGDARQDAAGKLTAEADAAGGEAGEAAGVAGVEAGPAQPAQEQPQGISEEQAAAMLAKAEAFKAEGNALYGEGKYEDAVIKYEEAIDAGEEGHVLERCACTYLPLMHPLHLAARTALSCSGHAAVLTVRCPPNSPHRPTTTTFRAPPLPLAAPPGPTAAKQRAVYLANLAACDLQAKRYSEAVRACSAALEEDPTYLKVRGLAGHCKGPLAGGWPWPACGRSRLPGWEPLE